MTLSEINEFYMQLVQRAHERFSGSGIGNVRINFHIWKGPFETIRDDLFRSRNITDDSRTQKNMRQIQYDQIDNFKQCYANLKLAIEELRNTNSKRTIIILNDLMRTVISTASVNNINLEGLEPTIIIGNFAPVTQAKCILTAVRMLDSIAKLHDLPFDSNLFVNALKDQIFLETPHQLDCHSETLIRGMSCLP